MREVDDFGRGDAREEVLGPAREPDHFVREHRPADEDVVVLDDEPVQRNRDGFPKAAFSQSGDVGGRDRAERQER